MLAVDKKSFSPSLSIDPRKKEEEGAAINGVCAEEKKKYYGSFSHASTDLQGLQVCECVFLALRSLSLSFSLGPKPSHFFLLCGKYL